MSKIKDVFFGGAEKKAAKEVRQAAEQGQEFIREGVQEARGDILPLFESAQQNRLLGGQAALDIFGAALPQQAALFGQGNVGAQQVIGQGSQQFGNAILGQPIDRSFLAPQELQADFGFLPTQLPDFQTSQQALNPEPVVPPPNIGRGGLGFLGGGPRGGRFNRFRGF